MANLRPARILLVPFGTRGDIEELVQIAIYLMRSGREVLFVADEDNVEYLRSHGIPVVVVQGASPSGVLAKLSQGGNTLKLVSEIGGNLRPIVPSVSIVIKNALDQFKPDLVIKTISGSLFGGAQFYQRQIPTIQVDPMLMGDPAVPYPSVLVPFSQVGVLNRILASAIELMLWHAIGRHSAKYVGVKTNLGKIRRQDLFHVVASPYKFFANEKPRDTAKVKFTDYIYPVDPQELPADIAAFVSKNPNAGLIALGSVDLDPDQKAALIQILPQLGPLLVVGGYGALSQDIASDKIMYVKNVPYLSLETAGLAWVLHRGGVGATSIFATLGIPQIILPKISEQWTRAGRIDQLGIGVNLDNITGLLEAVETAKSRKAKALKESQFFGRTGLSQTVLLIEKLIQSLQLD